MASPIPKPADQRARRNKDTFPMKVVEAAAAEQPKLPRLVSMVDGKRVPRTWPAQTKAWWEMWGRSPLAAEFTENDWSELMDTARIHAAFWDGDTKVAAELRLRVANFGATPSDRARLRITFAQAEQAEDKTVKPVKAPTFSGLRVTA